MQGNNVLLLLRLYEKTSAKGNTYFAGRMGQASVVMMRDLHAEGDDPVWQVFVSEPRQAGTEATGAPRAGKWAPNPLPSPHSAANRLLGQISRSLPGSSTTTYRI